MGRTLAVLMVFAVSGPAMASGHEALDGLLRTHVRGGRVGYAALRENRAPLDSYVVEVAGAKLGGLSRSAKLAFYLNAYNALVLQSVVDASPDLKSVRDVAGFFDAKVHVVAGRKVTLNQLENDIIRPKFGDPRIHFALVCAAKSCPPLPSRAFRARTVKKTLDRLARRFLKSRRGVVPTADGFAVSKLFEWYAKDFETAAGSVGAYLGRYRAADAATLLGGKLTFLDYDWALNGR